LGGEKTLPRDPPEKSKRVCKTPEIFENSKNLGKFSPPSGLNPKKKRGD